MIIGSLIRGLVGNRLISKERGGVALIMLVGFIGLAVPMVIASIQTGGQLSPNSRVYDTRLTGAAAVEAGLHHTVSSSFSVIWRSIPPHRRQTFGHCPDQIC